MNHISTESPDKSSEEPEDAADRFRLAKLVGCVGFVVGAVCGALLVPVPFTGRAATAIGDLVHAPLFGTLALATLIVWDRIHPIRVIGVGDSPWRRLMIRGLLIWITWSAFGVLIELIQSETGRSASRHDAIANALGIATAVSGYAAFQFFKDGRRRSGALFALAAVMIFIPAWWRPVTLLADVARMPAEFPLLASFETSAELTRWYGRDVIARRVGRDSSDGGYAYDVWFDEKRDPAITLVDLVEDWSGFEALELDAKWIREDGQETQVGESIELMIKVIDRTVERDRGFWSSAQLAPNTFQRIRIPLSDFRPTSVGDVMDLTKMVYVDIGPVDAGRAVRIRFDRLMLVR